MPTGLFSQPQCLASLMYMWLNDHKSHNHGPKSSGGYYNIIGGLNLEWDVQKSHLGVMVSHPQMFGHVMYASVCTKVMISKHCKNDEKLACWV